jgi:hypothetical protein
MRPLISLGTRRPVSCTALGAVLLFAPFARAQWDPVHDAKAPRNTDGSINLNGPVPKQADGKPDLTGVWQHHDRHLQFNLAEDTPGVVLKEPYASIYKQRLAREGRDRPAGFCLPHSIPDAMLPPTPFKFIHAPGETLILYEEFVDFRQIFTDSRKLPKDPEPAWFGYSVGRWEGDTFVIETSGFNEKSWLDDDGHPHSDALRTIESFRRTDYGHIAMTITIDDPKAYEKPWTAKLDFDLIPEVELIEGVCDNEADQRHMVVP